MTKTWAMAETVPGDVSYITPGKWYGVGAGRTFRLFAIKADDGRQIDCLWRSCAHLGGGIWTRHDGDTPPEGGAE